MSATIEAEAPPPAERKAMGDKFRNSISIAMPDNTKNLPPPLNAPASPPVPKPAEKPPAEPPPKQPGPKPEPPPTPPPAPPVPKPGETKPNEAPRPEADPEMPKNAKDWKAFKEVKDKAIADFRAADTERNALKAEAAAVKAELESLKKGSAEYERVKAEHQEALKALAERDDVLAKVFVEHDPKFQSHFNNRLAMAKADAQEIVGKDLQAKLDAVLSMSPSDHRKELIEALGAELTPFQQSQLATAYQQIRLIERERQAELEKAGENKKLILAERERKEKEQAEQIEANRRAMIAEANSKIEPELAGFDAATASHLKSTTQKAITGEVSRDEFLNILTHAVRGHKYEKDVAALKEENAKLQAQVSELTATQPSPNGTGGSAPVRRDTSEPTAQNMGREIGSRFKEELAKRK